ncbi:MAG TPA: hypothetical protein VGF91_10435 [Solirubrobacteraceae bacterium]|jgi:hypothetical protein
MTTTVTPDVRQDHPENHQSQIPASDVTDTSREDDRLDPKQRRTIALGRYADPTQGRKIGADPYDDPTQGRKLGADPYDDPTRGR